MPTLEFVSMFMNEHCEDVKENAGKFHCRCPICGDSQKSKRKKRFHLTFYTDDKIIYNCFNCNASGTFTKLYAFLTGMDEKEAYKELHGVKTIEEELKKPITKKLKPEDKALIGTVDYREMLKKDCVCENVKNPGYIENLGIKFLKKFRKDRDVPEDVKLYFCFDGKYKNRIIIPIYDKMGRMIYFQGRRISPKQEPKYFNPESPKSIIIPNIERLDFSKPVIITEGLLDSFSVSNGTTCLGKSISEDFIKSLFKHNEDLMIIIVFDNDEPGKKSLEKFLNENKYCKKVFYFVWKKFPNVKDLNQMKVENKLSISDMDDIVKKFNLNFYDYMTIRNLYKEY